MTKRFHQIVDPIFRYMIDIQRRFVGPGMGHPSLNEVHDELVRLFHKARSSAAAEERPRDYTELAEFALVYWVDEVLINSDWAHAGEWRGHRLLEWEFYGEALAGDKFYAKAELARDRSRDAFETFFLCVALGFQGRFARDKALRPRWREGAQVHPELKEWGRQAYRIVRENLDRFAPRDDSAEGAGPGRLPGRALLLRVSILVCVTILTTLLTWIATYSLRGV
jgi:type IV/VI secretion system ImpK/VasF family protein